MRIMLGNILASAARWAGLGLLLLHLSAAPAFSLGLEPADAIAPRGTDRGLLAPLGLAYDSFRGYFIVANTEAHRVEILSREGDSVKVLGQQGNLRFPRAVAAGGDATLFIAAKESEVIRVVPQYDSGIGEEMRELDLVAYRQRAPVQVVALAVDREGNLYVADRGNRQILVFDRQQRFKLAIPDVGEPTDVAAGAGVIYVADPGFGGIRVYDAQGRRLRTIGTDPGRFPAPLRVKALAIDRRERLWVLEEADQGIRVLDTFGNLLLNYPFSPGGGWRIFSTVDMTIDPDRFIHVLEQGTGLIRVFRIHEF